MKWHGMRPIAAARWLVAVAAFAVGMAHAATVGKDGPFPAATQAAIDAALEKSLAATQAPGVVVGIWIPGEGTYVDRQGISAIPRPGSPCACPTTCASAASRRLSPSTALLILANEDKIVLDDPVSKYFGFVPNGKSITLRMLANMTSGLFNYTEDEAWQKQMLGDTKRLWTPRELVNVGLAHPPYFEPGKGWHYSNTNTVLLGMIIEKVTGKPVAQVYRREDLQAAQSQPDLVAHEQRDARAVRARVHHADARQHPCRRDLPQSELGVHGGRDDLDDARSQDLGRVVRHGLADLARAAEGAD